MTINTENQKMLPLWLAPDLVPLSEAHRYLPISRSSVYELERRGLIQAQALPRHKFVTRAELRRLRGRVDEDEQPSPTEPSPKPQRRRRRPRPRMVAPRLRGITDDD